MQAFAEEARQTIHATLELATQALGEVELELKHLAKRADELRQRADDLRAFVRLGNAMLGTAGSPEVVTPTTPRKELTAAQKAHMVLAEEGHALRIPVIIQRLQDRGLGGNEQREAVKTALRCHPTVFTRPARGVYGLVEWSKTGVE